MGRPLEGLANAPAKERCRPAHRLFTSGVWRCAMAPGGLFFSGPSTPGEPGRRARHRAKELPRPSRCATPCRATCLANCRRSWQLPGPRPRQFVDVYDRFPEQCRYLLETLAWSIATIHRPAASASPEARLACINKRANDNAKLHDWLRRQLDDKLTEPNSALGSAIRYLLRHWES